VIEVKAEHLSRKDTYVLPFNDSGMDKYLAPTTLIQSDDEVIKTLAKSIIKEENDAKKAVNKLYLWVYENIEKKPTLSIPSALEVVKTKQGDCNEHAVLFTALCRAIQVPARICAGIVYVNEGFFYHAWTEIFLGRWITIDPTLKQFPADVTHIKFFEGEMEDQLGVLNLVGRLEIEVLEQK
jgi:transglutaminase-like putative cysteine protease